MEKPKCFGQLPRNWNSSCYVCGLCLAREQCAARTAGKGVDGLPPLSTTVRFDHGTIEVPAKCVKADEPAPWPASAAKAVTGGTMRWVPETLKSGIDTILDERGKRYGKFTNHADISQDFKHRMQGCASWPKLAPDQKEALEMIAHKVARILNGDPNYADSWVDIAGYAQLVADRLEDKAR